VTYDDVDAHLPMAGALHRAVLPMAWYLAWCAQHDLLSQTAVVAAGNNLLRLRYREITPAEFFVPLAAGELSAQLLTSAGQQFTQRYYADFLQHVQQHFGERLYQQADDWQVYAQVAPFLSQRLFKPAPNRVKSLKERGWKFWK